MKHIRILLFVILISCSGNYDKEQNYGEYIRPIFWGNTEG